MTDNRFGSNGWIMMNRSRDRSTTAIEALKQEFGGDADISFVLMDLASLNSVREAAAELHKNAPQIDALICTLRAAVRPDPCLSRADRRGSKPRVQYGDQNDSV